MAWKIMAGVMGVDQPAETISYHGNPQAAKTEADRLQQEQAPEPEMGDIVYWVEETQPAPKQPKPYLWGDEDNGK